MKNNMPFVFFMMIVITSSCGDIERERKILKTGKDLENIRIKICANTCDTTFSKCISDVEEGIKNSQSADVLTKELDACRGKRTTCFNECLQQN